MSQPKIRTTALDTGTGASKVVTTDVSGNVALGSGTISTTGTLSTGAITSSGGIVATTGLTAHGSAFATTFFSGQTTNATPLEIFIDGVNNSRFVLANNTSVSFTFRVVARGTTGAVGETASYLFHGFVKRVANAASTAVLVTQVDAHEDSAGVTAAVSADVTNGALILTVTGELTKTIEWRAFLETLTV